MISTALYFHVGYLDYMLVIEEVAENTHVDSCNGKAGQLLNIMMYNHYLPKCSIETATMYKYIKKKKFSQSHFEYINMCAQDSLYFRIQSQIFR